MTPTWGETIQHLTEYLTPVEPDSRRAILLYLSERVFPAGVSSGGGVNEQPPAERLRWLQAQAENNGWGRHKLLSGRGSDLDGRHRTPEVVQPVLEG